MPLAATAISGANLVPHTPQPSGSRKRGFEFKGGDLHDGFGGFGGSGEHLALLLLVLRKTGQRGDRDGFDGFGGCGGCGGFGRDGYPPETQPPFSVILSNHQNNHPAEARTGPNVFHDTLGLRSAPPHTGSPGSFRPGTPEESEKSTPGQGPKSAQRVRPGVSKESEKSPKVRF